MLLSKGTPFDFVEGGGEWKNERCANFFDDQSSTKTFFMFSQQQILYITFCLV